MGSDGRAMGAGEQAWDWERLRRICIGEARRLLRDPDEVEEAVQEAMARAWRQRHRCREPDAPGPWLRRIARNEALRLLKRRSATRESELDPDLSAAGAERGEEVVERLAVWDALAQLPEEDRELVTLRYLADLSQPEIARRLDIPEATVRVRLHRIRKRLRTMLP